MNGDNIVIVIEGGIVRNVYSDNLNVQAIIIDIDNKIRPMLITSNELFVFIFSPN